MSTLPLIKRLKLFLHSLGFALEGIVYTFAHHQSFQIQAVAAAAAVFLGVWLKISWIEWLVLILVISLVLTAELLNTGLECALDYVAKEHDLTVKAAKDAAAGAVLVASVGALLVGLWIFLPRLF